MAQQTAVEWIAEKMEKLTPPGYQIAISIMLDKAKQMEKEQKKYFFECGRNFQLTGENTFEQCYNETYGKE